MVNKIYGVIINTTDGTTYALRHLENIWKGKELAWSTLALQQNLTVAQ